MTEHRAWTVVVPVKRAAAAKTRLAVLPADLRQSLARSMAADTVAAAIDCPRVAEVIVVTDDPASRDHLSALGATVIPDVPDAGLNPALEHGARRARARRPHASVAAVSADLPALRPGQLDAVLEAIERVDEGFVSDAAGSGTTVYGVTAHRAFRPRFGAASSAIHRTAGATEVNPPGIDTVRRDVDTLEDLWAAERLGLGTRTAELVHQWRGLSNLPLVQATVRAFDPTTRTGSVVLDDGTELPFDAPAFDAGRLRLVRLGQRVRIRVVGEGADQRVAFLTLATLPDAV